MTTRRPSRSNTPRRQRQWENSRLGITTLAAVTTGVTPLSIPRDLGERKGLTVVRIIGTLSVSNTAADNSTQDWLAGIGIAITGTNVPNPTDDEYPWLWWDGGITRNDQQTDRIVIDTKAMRKLDPEEDLEFVIRNNDAESMLYGFALRALYLLA